MTKVTAHSFFTDFDIDLFKGGKHYRLYNKLGSHITTLNGEEGTYFAVWAPSAKAVSVVGDFNFWNEEEHQLNVRWDGSGIWEGFIPNVGKGNLYKYKIHSHNNGIVTEKADPFARRCEHPPKTASVVWDDPFIWGDGSWMKKRHQHNAINAPYSVYEVHLASWKRKFKDNNRSLSYVELADELVSYVKEMQFTHVELMPIMEYPYDPSWGYQITGYFAPTSRFGYPDDFKFLIDKFHQNDIGVILDWVPSHFPEDDHGLGLFDGTHLYEHPDKRKGYHPDWKSLIFNYGRNEVKSFLISNAIFWLDQFHVDGLRVDAVASMIFLDYSRNYGEWEPNMFGGNEYLEAIDFLKELNEEVYKSFPDVQTIAEESTAFPKISRPTYLGGLGFGMKWMMGWMHDSLQYFSKEPIYRRHHQNDLTFSMTYAFTENFMLPLSHDEVVHGKRSIIGRMPGDEWQKFANLRLLYSYMFTHPGAKLLFMGAEFGQHGEWNFQESLDWYVLEYDFHSGVQKLVKDLNVLYRKYPALYEKQFEHDGFEWISYDDHENSVISYIRKGNSEEDSLVIVCNMTPIPRANYRIGLPKLGNLTQIFNSDYKKYGGSGVSNKKNVSIDKMSWNHREFSAEITLPPLGALVFKIES
ncbi:1,4-alpha-glucan branching enzyme [Tenacibaculum skagerrakense]|uniref:1,4-alpha-glucan branching enzyme GlgB n=1 Tax=Tenacibaculum skagerrakense TaxID=186571 RepID=A0A4R2NNJ6_9FLAO|nr:1,4-alpha-glucan branching protein GlgB [Tenacibaculum skagerrakense]TCP22878.1 1,4-alpha-glucan branching enzyme [Tenacibaculum skagerrakense]